VKDPNAKRINLRFDLKTFRELTAKKGIEGVAFQDLGEGWFLEWLRGKRGPAEGENPFPGIDEGQRTILKGVLRIMERAEQGDKLARAHLGIIESLAKFARG
jgi:hypothetical protein